MASTPFSRREFLGTAAATTGLLIFPHASLFAKRTDALRLAGIGVGNKGRHNLDQLADEDWVAFCDVDTRFLGSAGERWPKAKAYRDYRKMFEAEGDRLDGVVISTTDHMHAPATAVALQLGIPVYCEKPLTHTVTEARVIAELAAEKKVATQMGTQIHATSNYRRVVEWIRAGAIGDVKEVHCWCNKGWSDGRFGPAAKVPSHLDWDLWLGAAKERDYCDNVHPGNWRRFWEYGAGTFGDMACHIVDLPFWALDLKYPTRVKCRGPEPHDVGAPSWTIAEFDFPRKKSDGSDGSLTLTWSDGGHHTDLVKNTLDAEGNPLANWGLGILFVGEKGMLVADYGRRQLLPKGLAEGFTPPAQSIPDSVGHWKEWTNAIRNGTPTTCSFDYSGPLTETVLLGIVAYRSGMEFAWDAANLRAGSSARANELLTKDYRAGFEVVGLERRKAKSL